MKMKKKVNKINKVISQKDRAFKVVNCLFQNNFNKEIDIKNLKAQNQKIQSFLIQKMIKNL